MNALEYSKTESGRAVAAIAAGAWSKVGAEVNRRRREIRERLRGKPIKAAPIREDRPVMSEDERRRARNAAKRARKGRGRRS